MTLNIIQFPIGLKEDRPGVLMDFMKGKSEGNSTGWSRKFHRVEQETGEEEDAATEACTDGTNTPAQNEVYTESEEREQGDDEEQEDGEKQHKRRYNRSFSTKKPHEPVSMRESMRMGWVLVRILLCTVSVLCRCFCSTDGKLFSSRKH